MHRNKTVSTWSGQRWEQLLSQLLPLVVFPLVPPVPPLLSAPPPSNPPNQISDNRTRSSLRRPLMIHPRARRVDFCLLSLEMEDDGKKTCSSRSSREDANKLCSRQGARDTPEGCRPAAPSLIKTSKLHFYSLLPFPVRSDHPSVSSCWTLPLVYNFLSIFIFSLAPFSNIFPSAEPHHPPLLTSSHTPPQSFVCAANACYLD